MCGREREWHAVQSLLERRSSGILLVEGEPGMGKSWLLSEAADAARADGFAVIAEGADELTRYMPLFLGLKKPPATLAQEPAHLRLPGLQMSLVDSVRVHLEQRAHAGPVLVCLDDLQWADAVTLVALRLLPWQMASYPLAWILARSSLERASDAGLLFDALEQEGAARIRLLPLADDAVEGLIASRVGAEVGADLLALAAGAAGNPAMVAELVAGLADEDCIVISEGRAGLAAAHVPQRIQAMVRTRLDSFSAPTRQLLKTAAVLGRSFRLEDAAAMLGSPAATLLTAIDEAMAARVLMTTQDALAFRHELVRQSVTESLAPPVKQALHRQFGEILLERGGSEVQAAVHLLKGIHGRDTHTLARLDQVLAAVVPLSPETAADVAACALDLTGPEDPQLPARSAAAGEALAAAGRLAEADTVIRDALAQPMPAPQDAQLHAALASVLHLRGLDVEASAEAERALAEPQLLGRLRDHATVVLLQALASGRETRRAAQLACDIRATPKTHTREVLVAALIVLAALRWDEGQMTESLDLCREAVLLAGNRPPDARLAQARLALASYLLDIHRFDEADPLIRLAGEQPGSFADLESPVSAALLRARIDLAEGRLDDALAELEAVGQIADSIGSHLYWANSFSVRANVALRRGDIDSQTGLGLGLDDGHHLASSYGQMRNDVAAAQIAEARQGSRAAMPLLSNVYAALDMHRFVLISEPVTAPWLVRVALAAGETELAKQTASAADDVARENPRFPTVAAAAEHAKGILGRDPDRLEQACHLHADPWARASAAEDLGVLVMCSAQRSAAIPRLSEALTGYEQAGATRDMARVRRRLRQLGVRRRHWASKRGPVTGWGSLTGTEREISALVSHGLTNQQIADRLFVSMHTVACHLRQVFRKLGIASRVELTRIAVEQTHQGAQ
jgi:DNA-binding CsgD family transcriptional regulator/tetratricopeptide (TPR) repeat protein